MTDGRYIPALPLESRITCLRSPTGSGKTQAIGVYVREAVRAGKKVIVVVPRRTLAASYARQLGIPSYLDVTGHITDSVVICCDSLRRVDPTIYDLVVMDEYVMIRRQTHGAHVKDGRMVLRARRELLRSKGRVVIADALLGDADLDDITRLSGSDDIEVRTTSPNSETYRAHDKKDELVVQIRQWAARGERVALAVSGGPKACRKLGQDIAQVAPSSRVLVITRDGAENQHGERVELPHGEGWRSWDHLVYSPALGTGVSIDVRGHFEHVAAIVWRNTVTAEDVYQAVHRVRHPADPAIHVWIQKGGRANTNEGRLLSRIKQAVRDVQARANAVDTCNRALLGLDLGWIDLSDPRWAKDRVRTLCDIRNHGGDGGNIRQAFLSLVEGRGATVEVAERAFPDKEVRATMKAVRATHKAADDQWAQKVVEAKPADDPKTATPAQKERAVVMERYGVVSQELVKAGDKGWRRAQAWAHLWAARHGYQDSLAVADKHERELHDPMKRRLETTDTLAALLGAVPGLLDFVSGVGGQSEAFPVSRADAENALNHHQEVRRRIQERGWFKNDPMKTLGAALRDLGLEWVGRQRRERGVVVREYSVSNVSVAKMAEWTRVYRERLVEGCRPSEGPSTLSHVTPEPVAYQMSPEERRACVLSGEVDFSPDDVKDEWTRLIKMHFPDWVPPKPGASAVLSHEMRHARDIARGYMPTRAFAAMERFFERLPSLLKQAHLLKPGYPPEFRVFAQQYMAVMDREVTTGISLKDAAKKDAPGWVREKPKLLGNRDNDGQQRSERRKFGEMI